MTAALLLSLLHSGPMTTEELSREVERLTSRRVPPRVLCNYLRYYARKGWVTKSSPLWSLTPQGEALVRKYEPWLSKLLGIIREHKQAQPGTIVDTRSDEIIVLHKTLDVERTVERLRDSFRLSPDEADALRALLEHHARTGSTYTYVDDLAAALRVDPSWLYQEVLRKLKAKRLVYVWRDGKVGLGRNLRRALGLE